MSGRNRKWVDKKNAQTYAVVYRSHEDAQYHDEDASENVLVPIENKNDKKKSNKHIKSKAQLEIELQNELKSGKIRGNEGEAALYGITFDDSKYDYMQHLRPIGDGSGVFIAKKKDPKLEKKNKSEIQFKDDIAEASENGADNNDDLESQLPLGSTKQRKVTYQDMQGIPDAISGFKPDMDPRLREVLEALEDEEYVEDDEDVFNDLLQGGERPDDEHNGDEGDEWDLDEFDDEGYNTDDFAKEGDQGWEADFRKFQKFNKNAKNDWDSDDEFEDEEEDEVPDLPNIKSSTTGKKKSKSKERKKKGAMTDTSSFSMSSSALLRSEGLTLLDDRFEKLQINYNEEDYDDYREDPKEFDIKNERTDFESMLDDFLDNHELEKGGRRIVKKDATKAKLQKAADSVSRGKLAKKRNKATS